jgi:GNAT superfamily N-acetyltransferase
MAVAVEFVCDFLADAHDLSSFDSGQPTLDEWLRKSARDSDGRNVTRTSVWHRADQVVVAYYTLMPYFIERDTLGKKQGRGLPDRIPCYLIARLALDRTLRGHGLGTHLLASALTRAALGARDMGGRYVVVDAIDGSAASFYRHHGFESIASRPDRLLLATKALASYLPPVPRPGDSLAP